MGLCLPPPGEAVGSEPDNESGPSRTPEAPGRCQLRTVACPSTPTGWLRLKRLTRQCWPGRGVAGNLTHCPGERRRGCHLGGLFKQLSIIGQEKITHHIVPFTQSSPSANVCSDRERLRSSLERAGWGELGTQRWRREGVRGWGHTGADTCHTSNCAPPCAVS